MNEEKELLNNYQTNKCKKSLQKLIQAHDKFLRGVAKRYTYLLPYEDVYQITVLYFIEYLKYVKSDKGKISTCIYRNLNHNVRAEVLSQSLIVSPSKFLINLETQLFYCLLTLKFKKNITQKEIDEMKKTLKNKSAISTFLNCFQPAPIPQEIASVEDKVYCLEVLDEKFG